VLWFLTRTLRLPAGTAYWCVGIGLLLGSPVIVLSGWLSDRIGRRKLILTGFVAAALSWLPVFRALTAAADPALALRMQTTTVVLRTPDAEHPVSLALAAILEAVRRIALPPRAAEGDGERARAWLVGNAVPFALAPAPAGAPVALQVPGQAPAIGFDEQQFARALATVGYGPAAADAAPRAPPDTAAIALLVALLVAITAVACGPVTAFLVEQFPARVRYTSLSLPYHLGNGWFGGFLPLIAGSLVVATGDVYAGLWYPMAVALGSALVGALWLRPPRGEDAAPRVSGG